MKMSRTSVGNSHRSVSLRLTTLEEDRELFVDFSSILCLWFEIKATRTYNLFDWVSNTVEDHLISEPVDALAPLDDGTSADRLRVSLIYTGPASGIVLCKHQANERWCYSVTPSLIGWVYTQIDLCSTCKVQGKCLHKNNVLITGMSHEHHGISNHQPISCWCKSLSGLKIKKTLKLYIMVFCEGNPPVTNSFPSQKAFYAESVSMVVIT